MGYNFGFCYIYINKYNIKFVRSGYILSVLFPERVV